MNRLSLQHFDDIDVTVMSKDTFKVRCHENTFLHLRKTKVQIICDQEMTLVQAFGFLSDPGYFVFSAFICLYL